MIRVIFKSSDYPLRSPQEVAFSWPQPTWDAEQQISIPPVSTPVQYVDVLIPSIPEGMPVVGRMDEPGVWATEPPFPVPHHFSGWEPATNSEEIQA